MDTEERPQLEFREWLGDQMDIIGIPDQTEFAELVGVAQSSISDWLRGEGLPRKSSIIKIANALGLPVFEVERVVKQTRVRASGGVEVGARVRISVDRGQESVLRPVDVAFIPIVGTAAADTLRAYWGNGDLYPVLRKDIAGLHDPVLYVVSGDCMEPRINDGDLVILDRMGEPQEGDVVAVRVGEETTLKEYWPEGDEIVLRAIKPGYQPIRIKVSDQGAAFLGVARAWFRSGRV